ncbi:unnamed protein product [Orchesella dallaii]|uniref:DUF4806 domain-containing protein n=1 Tax=Orchesella dallaii TaxID=48710 RepID=A0ABP1RN35_9HEXA
MENNYSDARLAVPRATVQSQLSDFESQPEKDPINQDEFVSESEELVDKTPPPRKHKGKRLPKLKKKSIKRGQGVPNLQLVQSTPPNVSDSDESLISLPSFDELLSRMPHPSQNRQVNDVESPTCEFSDLPHVTTPRAQAGSSRCYGETQFNDRSEIVALKEMCAANFAMIKANQKNMLSMMTAALTLVEGMKNVSAAENDEPDLFEVSFPMKTILEFENVEELLLNNKQFSTYVRGKLRVLGGSSLVDVTNGILRFLMTDELANYFNYTGKGTKQRRPFMNSKLNSIIFETIIKDVKLDVTRNVIEKAVASWLRHTADRIKYEPRKPSNPMNRIQNQDTT